MKKIETAFSCLSFAIAALSALMLSYRMVDAAYFTATLGTMMTIIAYGVFKRLAGNEALAE